MSELSKLHYVQDWTSRINAESGCQRPGEVILPEEDVLNSRELVESGKIGPLATIQLDSLNIAAVIGSLQPGDVYGLVRPQGVFNPDGLIQGASHLTVLGKTGEGVEVRITKPGGVFTVEDFEASSHQAARLLHKSQPTGGLYMLSGALSLSLQSGEINASDSFIGCSTHGGHDNPNGRSIAILSAQRNGVSYPVERDSIHTLSIGNFPNGALIIGRSNGVAAPFVPLSRPGEIADTTRLDEQALARTITTAALAIATRTNNPNSASRIAMNLVDGSRDVLSMVGKINFDIARSTLFRAATTGT